ncbi:hypothetical protein ACWD04_16320 [Streptomyces sp. NPDC002911]
MAGLLVTGLLGLTSVPKRVEAAFELPRGAAVSEGTLSLDGPDTGGPGPRRCGAERSGRR